MNFHELKGKVRRSLVTFLTEAQKSSNNFFLYFEFFASAKGCGYVRARDDAYVWYRKGCGPVKQTNNSIAFSFSQKQNPYALI